MRFRSMFIASVATLSLVAVGCGGSKSKPSDSATSETTAVVSTTVATTVPETPKEPWPLTGEPSADAAAFLHPVVMVKMDNSPEARPQTGLNQADVVYEVLVEGITRYALAFHSDVPEVVGPVRSARSTDISLMANLSRPLLVWSGGNAGVVGEVRGAAHDGILVDAGYDVNPDAYWRDNKRAAPHNLYADARKILDAHTPDEPVAPKALFGYLDKPAVPATAGSAVSGYSIDFGGAGKVRVEYVWDAERNGWDRFQTDQSHSRENSATVDSDGVQVAPANIVIIFISYGRSPSDPRSPMAITTGEGDAVVLTGGHAIEARWSRTNGADAWTITDAAGAPVKLNPGRTWVALPQAGQAVEPMGADQAQELLGHKR